MNTLTGKVAAVTTVVLMLVGGFFLVRAVLDIQSGFPFEIVEVTESLDPDECRWEVQVTMRNDSPEPVEVERIVVILNRGRSGSHLDLPPIATGDTTTATMSWNARTSEGCPASVDEVNHGTLTVHLNDDRSVSTRF